MDAARPVPIFRARVNEQGKLCPREAGRWAGFLARLRGRDVEVIVRVERKHRSLNAGRYYWGVVVAAGVEWSGYEPQEFHDAMKAIHLPRKQLVLPTGEILETLATTHDMDTEQFSEFTNRVKRWLAGNGCLVPEASEVA